MILTENLKRAGNGEGLLLSSYKNRDSSELILMESPLLKEQGEICHGFSTRFGGVSQGKYQSMNLSFTRGDEEDAVRENFRRIAAVFGQSEEQFVLTYQTHTANVRKVTGMDRGKGVSRERDYRDVDALITDEPGLILGVFWADCVPILFYDPEHHAIGAAHSGWRGTAAKIGKKTVEEMKKQYGTREEAVLAVIGPSICRSCYEISEDVAEKFREAFPGHEAEILKAKPRKMEEMLRKKYLLDLWEANRIALREAGLREEHIEIGNICTCCNPWLAFSHRKQGEERGNNGAFLMLKE